MNTRIWSNFCEQCGSCQITAVSFANVTPSVWFPCTLLDKVWPNLVRLTSHPTAGRGIGWLGKQGTLGRMAMTTMRVDGSLWCTSCSRASIWLATSSPVSTVHSPAMSARPDNRHAQHASAPLAAAHTPVRRALCMQAQVGTSCRVTEQPTKPAVRHSAGDAVHAREWVGEAGGLTVGAYMYHNHLGVVLGFAGQLPMLQPPQQLLDPVTWRAQLACQSGRAAAWHSFPQKPSPACKIGAMATFMQMLEAHEITSTSSSPG